MTRQQYYDALTRYAQSVPRFLPVPMKQFHHHRVMVVCRVIVMVYMTALFGLGIRHTFLGNSWQAVAQVVSEATAPLLEGADGMRDEEGDKAIRQNGVRARGKFRVVKCDETGRRELMRWGDGRGFDRLDITVPTLKMIVVRFISNNSRDERKRYAMGSMSASGTKSPVRRG